MTAFSGWFFGPRLDRWLSKPHHPLRVELLRIGAPLAILGFMSSRVAHADEWLGDGGFRVPDLGVSDYRQPLFIPTLPTWAAWAVAFALVVSGLAIAVGFRARQAALVFFATTAFVALSDRLAAFSVSKMAPMIALTIAFAPVGRLLSLDAWLEHRRVGASPPRGTDRSDSSPVPSGSLRFVQVLLPVIYSASGIAKIRGDWLTHSHVLWTHLHDTYQTAFTLALANTLPPFAWTLLQGITVIFEAGAPLWFGHPRTRTLGMLAGIGMHTMIGLMFGPVRWFAMLMTTLLLTAYLPDRYLEQAVSRLHRRRLGAGRAPAGS